MPRPTLLLALLASVPLCAASAEPAGTIVWTFDRLAPAGAGAPTVLGQPEVRSEGGEKEVWFNGADAGLDLPVNPVAGWANFTVQVLICPDADGKPEQRFFHIQQLEPVSRLLLEIRLTPQGKWSLDTFLNSHGHSLPLLDRTKEHPAGRWAWAALVYDGRKMTSYVDGVKQLDGPVEFAPMASGHTTVGVRINRVYWFKGGVRQARFTPEALAPDRLEKAGGP